MGRTKQEQTYGSIGPQHWKGMKMSMEVPTRVERRIPPPMIMPIKWNPPDEPWIKLNSKGKFHNEAEGASGGGIIRDHHGSLVKAFATPFAAHSALETELLSLLHGLLMAKELGNPIWIELDDAMTFSLITSRNMGPTHSRQSMACPILLLRDCTTRITLSPPEGNKEMEFLDKLGSESTSALLFDGTSAPRHLKGSIWMEQQGIPNIRIENEEEE